MASKVADRGKWAEGKVQGILKGASERVAEFDFERLPDARAARGALKAQIADFAWFRPGQHGVIEVKETEHDYRLPRDKLAQLARLRKRGMAGGLVYVIVYHSTLKKWRCAPLSFFDGDIPSSWDLSALPLYDTVDGVFTMVRVLGG